MLVSSSPVNVRQALVKMRGANRIARNLSKNRNAGFRADSLTRMTTENMNLACFKMG